MWATLAGLVTGVVIGFTSDFFTGDDRPPVVETAKVSGSGSAINIITGFSYGLISIVPSVIGIVIAMLIAYYVGEASSVINGVYGVAISAVGMLAISGMIVSSDAYGPIVDNARGIAEMAGMPEEVIDTTDVLDAAGNTAKAITKGFAISAAALTVLALFAAYAERDLLGLEALHLHDQPAQPDGHRRCLPGCRDAAALQRADDALRDPQCLRYDRGDSPPVPRATPAFSPVRRSPTT